MDASVRQLVACATEIARNMAYDQVIALAEVIRKSQAGDWSALSHRCLAVVPQLHFRAEIKLLLDIWRGEASQIHPDSVAIMLMGAAQATKSERSAQSIELIWTGPDSIDVSFRRTEQALLETIEAARKSLLIVSFAVYLVPALSDAIITAAQRGARIDICVESSTLDGGAVAYDPVAALGANILHHAQVYTWPRRNRPVTPNGKHGVLHAKCAVADSHMLFISSANLTEHAMAVNMELGVLIQGGPQPRQVEEQFRRLIDKGILQRPLGHNP